MMNIENALPLERFNALHPKVKDQALDVMNNAYFVGRVIDARTGEIIPVGENERYDVYLLPNI